MHKKTLSAALVTVLLAATSVSAMGEFGASDKQEPSPPSAESGFATSDHVAAMRRAARSVDALDASQWRLVADGIAEPRSARRVGDPSRSRHWVMPGADGAVCHVTNGFAGCPPVSLLDTAGVAPMLGYREGTYFVSGIATDEVTHVTLTDDSGVSRELRVVDNGFSVEMTSRPVRLVWRGPRGQEVFEYPDYLRQISEQRRKAMEHLGIPQGDADTVRSVPRR